MGKGTKKYKEGTKWLGKYGDFEIVKYVSKKEVYVKFNNTGYVKRTQPTNISNGSVKDPYYPNVSVVGCVGLAETSLPCGKVKVSYHTWRGMLGRCYDPKYRDNNPTYAEVKVCEEWKCFEVFEKWYDLNHKVGYEVDKDLTVVGCKLYSPETCAFIPNYVNCLIGCKSIKNKELPVGVSYHTRDDVYNSKCYDGTRLVHLGDFHCPEEARAVYVDYKTLRIQQVAKEALAKGDINQVVHDNLMLWEL